MPVNQSRPSPLAEGRLYLKEDELDRAVDLVFVASRRFWKYAAEALDARQLGPAHYRALAAVRREEGIPVSELQSRLGVRKQSLARVLSELEEGGFLRREPGQEDRRQRLVFLSEAGREAEREASAALRERLGQVFRTAGAEAVSGARAVWTALAAEPEE